MTTATNGNNAAQDSHESSQTQLAANALLKLVSQRRSLLDHLKTSDGARYQALISTLGLRR